MSAILSPCGQYRYRLERQLAPAGDPAGAVAFLMLNPSTADATLDDPTIRRCVGYARAWGYARLLVGNLYALRATQPKALWTIDDPIGPANDAHLRQIIADAALVVCAWGGHARPARARDVYMMIPAPRALQLTTKGAPSHPLYLRADLRPMPYLWRG